MQDIFDRIAPDKEDAFDRVDAEESALETIKSQLTTVLESFDARDRKRDAGRITADVKEMIRSEIAKIKPVQNVIERQIEQIIKHEQTVKHVDVPVHVEPRIIQAPPQIIKETRVEVEKKDNRKLVEEKTIVDLKKEIQDLREELKRTQETLPFIHGGSGVIGIPPPEGNETKVLTVKNNKASWQTATGGSGGGNADPTNVGDPTVNGTWRLTVNGTDLSFQRLEAGIWVEKGSMLA